MAKSLFDAAHRDALLARLARLRADSPRQWGKMTPSQMMCHLEDAVQCATGRKPVPMVKSALSNPLLWWLVIYVIPWPKGVRTVPEFQATQPAEFNADRERLIGVLKEASSRGASAPWSPHPAFGNIGGKHYGALLHRHVDHHLRQFGV